MMESPYRIRPATVTDGEEIRRTVKITLANPEGRAVRKKYGEAAERNELLVLERFDNKEHVWQTSAFVEFHTRIDGGMTIRDAGSMGEATDTGINNR